MRWWIERQAKGILVGDLQYVQISMALLPYTVDHVAERSLETVQLC